MQRILQKLITEPRTSTRSDCAVPGTVNGLIRNLKEIRKSKPCRLTLTPTKMNFLFCTYRIRRPSTGNQFAEWGRLTALLADENYDFTVHTGDITDNNDNAAEMDMLYENSGNLTDKPFIPVVGNHDQKSTTYAKLFKEYFGNAPGNEAPSPIPEGTTASLDYGNAHFVILNTESDLETQKQWLDDEFSKTDKKWKIVGQSLILCKP